MRGYWEEIFQFGKKGLQAARKTENKEYEKETYLGLGWTYLRMGNLQEAGQYIEKYIKVAKSLDDLNGIGIGICYLGKIAREKGEISKAYS